MTGMQLHPYEEQARHLAITSFVIGVVAAGGLVLLGILSFSSTLDPAEWVRVAISVVGTLGVVVGAGLAVFAWSQGEPHGVARHWAGAEFLLATVCVAVFVVMLNVAY